MFQTIFNSRKEKNTAADCGTGTVWLVAIKTHSKGHSTLQFLTGVLKSYVQRRPVPHDWYIILVCNPKEPFVKQATGRFVEFDIYNKLSFLHRTEGSSIRFGLSSPLTMHENKPVHEEYLFK